MINNVNYSYKNNQIVLNNFFKYNKIKNVKVFPKLNDNLSLVEKIRLDQVQHIRVTINGVRESIVIENIIRFEAYGNYTYVYLQNYTKPVLTSKTLKYYADLLTDTSFIRTHSKHLLNLKYVLGLRKGNILSLVNGTSVQVSRRKLRYVKQVLFGNSQT